MFGWRLARPLVHSKCQLIGVSPLSVSLIRQRGKEDHLCITDPRNQPEDTQKSFVLASAWADGTRD